MHLHGKMRPTYETIDALYERYIYELAQVILYKFYSSIKNSLNKIEKHENIKGYENIRQQLIEAYAEGLPY